ncbi:MAG: ABC transporter permease subunit [Firmicutes bacterium]|nr:ABC transporter permease subunit [Bacillota bacterium]
MNNEKGIWGSDWVGWQNFEYLFSSGVMQRVVVNTLVYNVVFLVLIVSLSLLIAYGLTQVKNKRMVSVYMAIFMIPSVLSWIIVSYISRSLLDGNGFINSILTMFGQDTKNFYLDSSPWFIILTIAYVWKNIGFYILIFYSAMSAVKKELMLSAAIDGAGKMKQFYKVVLDL